MADDKPKTEKKPQPAKAAKPAPAPNAGGKMAVILIRNITGASGSIRDTLKMLRLHTKLACAVFDGSGPIRGMLEKVKDYTTYGEIDEATLKTLQEKRGVADRKEYHLHPPRGGFERKGIKHSFSQGGALGYRGAKINDLIKKML